MVWLFVIGLLVWCLVLSIKLANQGVRMGGLKLEIDRLALGRGETAHPRQPEATPARPAAPPPITPDAARAPPTIAIAPPRPQPASAPAGHAAQAPRIVQPATHTGQSIGDWLSEKGLAWIGGGALALGGLMLVAYAAQRGFFTPAMRIIAAALLGFAAMGFGEALRRGVAAKGAPNLLVAALVTAAGATMLYAATWAAYALYGFIPLGAAAVLLASVSFGLLALAFLHGEALGLLAIAAAYLVPVLGGGPHWSVTSLDAYLLLILATGLTATGLRDWSRVGALTLALGWVWTLGRDAFGGDDAGISVLVVAAPALALAAVVLAGRLIAARPDKPPRLLAALPSAAIVASSLVALVQWTSAGAATSVYAAVTTAGLALIVAAGVGLRRMDPICLAGPAGVAVVATVLVDSTTLRAVDALWLLISLGAIAAAGFDGALRSDRRRVAAVVSAAGVALTLTLAAPALALALRGRDWGVDAVFAALFAGGAVVLARRAEDAGQDWAPAAWIAGSAEMVGLALRAGLDGRVAPTAYGLLGLLLAVLAVRVKWRGFAGSAVAACVVSLAALLAAPIAGAAIEGKADWLAVVIPAGAATLAQAAAWHALKARDDVQDCIEAISTSAVISGLLSVFLTLETLSASRVGSKALITGFTDDSLRTLLVLAAGLILSIRGGATPLGRARGPVLLGLGGFFGLLLQGLLLHPWWGAGGPVLGPPVFDGLMLALLAPALLLGEAARRLARQIKPAAGAAATAALLFLVLWMVSEIRRLFHGPVLTGGGFGYAEVAAYAAAVAALALALDFGRGQLREALDSKSMLDAVVEAIGWATIGLTVLLLGWVASPWWGMSAGDLQTPLLLALLYAIAGVCGIGLAYVVRRSGRVALAQTALAGAGIEVFTLLTLIVRYAFHGGAMRAPLAEDSLETWTFSAVWALYGLAALAIGAGRRDMALRGIGLVVLLGTTAKVFLFDMGHLEGVVRAASFLALGLVLLAGAMAARRFGAAGGKPAAPAGGRPASRTV